MVEAVRAGKPIPSGAVLTLVQWSVLQDDKGVPLKDKDGRFVKKDILAHTVMEKRTGWGAEYPASLRNGEWEYSVFNQTGQFNPKANFKACFECHLPHAKMDYVTSLAKLAGKFPDAGTVAKAPRGDVQIVGFKFMPRQDHRQHRQAAQVPQHRRFAALHRGAGRAEDRGAAARPDGVAHLRQAGRLRLHLRPAPEHEGDDRGQIDFLPWITMRALRSKVQ